MIDNFFQIFAYLGKLYKRLCSFLVKEKTEYFKNLMKLICDMKMMESAVRELQYDAEKAPLGKR